MSGGDLSGFSMLDLFRLEMDSQFAAITDAMLLLERNPVDQDQLSTLMRATHSIKGAAKMVDITPIVKIAHAMEDCFVAAQNSKLILNSDNIDVLLSGADFILQASRECDESILDWLEQHKPQSDALVAAIEAIQTNPSTPIPVAPIANLDLVTTSMATIPALSNENEKSEEPTVAKDRVLRVGSEHMDKLLGLAGETMVESRWLRPFIETMFRHKRYQFELVSDLDRLRDAISHFELDEETEELLNNLQRKANSYRDYLSKRLNELESYDHRTTNLASRLHREVIASRMRPFSDGTEGLQRMVRDVARSLDKKAKLEIIGLGTQVDRDVLEVLKAPLNHLLRNAVDHGIEMPQERVNAGKDEQGTIRLEAYHRAGMLVVNVIDDGRGVDLTRLKEKIIAKQLATADMVDNMTEAELLDFLFLPSFSTRDSVTEISGRGVGLDVVADSVREIRGMVTATTRPGHGMRFHLQLPLTLSVVRTLLAEIGGECYAFPLTRIDHLLKLGPDKVEYVEDREYLTWGDKHIGLASAAQVFGVTANHYDDQLAIVVISDRHSQYGVIVDRFLGERELAVHVMDPRLGKVKDISAVAMLDDGSPALIIDVDDLVRSIDNLVDDNKLTKLHRDKQRQLQNKRPRILVVDDSITVREVQRNLLENCGYEVDVAVDGMDGWNAVRQGNYDLVITDVDMPRMDGITLVEQIKHEPKLKGLQVMIVSYKDREEDRQRGLNAGADYYLTKGSFHDERLREAVFDLIGEA